MVDSHSLSVVLYRLSLRNFAHLRRRFPFVSLRVFPFLPSLLPRLGILPTCLWPLKASVAISSRDRKYEQLFSSYSLSHNVLDGDHLQGGKS